MGSANPHTRKFEAAKKILKIYEDAGFEVRFAGGCVRDRILGVYPKDYDLATNALPDQTVSLFEDHGYKVVPTGIDHGTVTIVTNEGPVEVTTLRRDVAGDGRHATVEFCGTDFEEDARRRDFTMNAMSEDLRGEIFDYFSGRIHIQQKLLVFVGNPNERIVEDYLRIMRFFRFWARFELDPDPKALDAIRTHAGGLHQISQERITSELWGLLIAEKPMDAFYGLHKTGVLKEILPELKEEGIKFLDRFESVPIPLRPRTRLALLVLFSGLDSLSADTLGVSLRLPIDDIRSIKSLVESVKSIKESRDSIPGQMNYIDQLEKISGPESFLNSYAPLWTVYFEQAGDSLGLEQVNRMIQCERASGHLRRAKLPLNGHDVMKHLGISADQKLGMILSQLKDAYREEQWKTRSEGFQWLDQNHGNE
jgi:tRNA nucleotidyltransferase/poly(A) polymerase